MDKRETLAPTLDCLLSVGEAAYREIPEELRRFVASVAIRVQEFPDDETLAEMGCESPFELLGLYRGIGLDRQESAGTPEDVDMIFLYRRPILDYWCETGEPLERVVRHVLIHEIGHHFGLSDDEMAAIEAAA
ncbi:MAG: metallopeptidase family protein [Alphaproteobacteria bacterium]|nr:metallopeptidase family protein [Alphaproteobacteria bacterium]